MGEQARSEMRAVGALGPDLCHGVRPREAKTGAMASVSGQGFALSRAGRVMALALVWLCGIGLAGAGDGGASETDFAALNDARDIYQTNCAMCHGYDGIPILPGAPNFASGERLDRPDTELIVSIRDGRETMPPWRAVLSEQEQIAVLAYTRLIAGDDLFLEHCESCHDSSVPAIANVIPKASEKLSNYGGPWQLCSSLDAEQTMPREDIITVIGYLRGIQKVELKGIPTEAGG